MVWQLEEATSKLDEVFTMAMEEGPQFVARGDEEVVVLSKDDYLKLTGEKPDFIQHLLSIPKIDDLDLTRDRSPMREFEW